MFELEFKEIPFQDAATLLLNYPKIKTSSGQSMHPHQHVSATAASVAALMGTKEKDKMAFSKMMKGFHWYTSELQSIYIKKGNGIEAKYWNIEHGDGSCFLAAVNPAKGHVAFLAGAYGSPETGF